MYFVMTKLEERFESVNEVMRYFDPLEEGEMYSPLLPRIPKNRMPDEDWSTRRICVAPTIEQCFTAIGLLGIFRRCLSANDGALSYATKGREVYPVVVVRFSDEEPYYKPTKAEVPDAEITGEHWLRHAAYPVSVRLLWLDMFSVQWESEDEPCICKSVRFLTAPDPKKYDHPWLNGRGHCLDSSESQQPGYEWPGLRKGARS